MNNSPKRNLNIQPFQGLSYEIGRWLWAIEDTRQLTLECLESLARETQDIIDWVSPVNGNSIGTLLYHLAAVEASWLYEEMLQQEFPPDIEALLPMAMRDEQHRLSMLVGISLEEHLSRLDKIRSNLLRAFSDMSIEDFRRPRQLPEYDVTPEWVLHHLMQHEGEHRGQITEMLLGAKQAYTTGTER